MAATIAALARVLTCFGALEPRCLPELLSRVAMPRYKARLASLRNRAMVPISPASSALQTEP